MAKMALNEQAQEIIKIAEESGVQSNFFFLTTFKRYQVQLNMLNDLEKAIKEDGALSKEIREAISETIRSSPLIYEYKDSKRFRILRDYINKVGCFEKFAEWGLY